MTTTTFDTLKMAKRLQDSGFDEKQAEALAESYMELHEARMDELATKADLRQETQTIRQELRVFEERTTGRFTLLQWMLGVNLAISLAVLWLLFRSMAT